MRYGTRPQRSRHGKLFEQGCVWVYVYFDERTGTFKIGGSENPVHRGKDWNTTTTLDGGNVWVLILALRFDVPVARMETCEELVRSQFRKWRLANGSGRECFAPNEKLATWVRTAWYSALSGHPDPQFGRPVMLGPQWKGRVSCPIPTYLERPPKQVDGYSRRSQAGRSVVIWRKHAIGRAMLFGLWLIMRDKAPRGDEGWFIRNGNWSDGAGVTSLWLHEELIRWFPAAARWYDEHSGHPLTPQIVWHRVDKMYRDGKGKCYSREHPQNSPGLRQYVPAALKAWGAYRRDGQLMTMETAERVFASPGLSIQRPADMTLF